MEYPEPPEDIALKNIIDKLAQFVARNGPDFEEMTKAKQKGNPKFDFLFGGELHNYYRYKVNSEQTSIHTDINGSSDNLNLAGMQLSNITNPPPAQWVNPTQNTLAIESLSAQQVMLNEQITQSQTNLNAQHAVLLQQQQYAIDNGISKAEEDMLKNEATECGISYTEFDSVLQPIIDTCTKESISAGKSWILQRATATKTNNVIAEYLLRKVIDPSASFTRRLHIIYLLNDTFHHCMRKGADELKKALEKVVVPMFCTTCLNVTEEQRQKLQKLINLWETKSHYFAVGVIEKLKNPTVSLTEYKEELMKKHADVVDQCSSVTKNTMQQYQTQHQAFVSHALQQIQNIDKEKLALEQQKQQVYAQQSHAFNQQMQKQIEESNNVDKRIQNEHERNTNLFSNAHGMNDLSHNSTNWKDQYDRDRDLGDKMKQASAYKNGPDNGISLGNCNVNDRYNQSGNRDTYCDWAPDQRNRYHSPPRNRQSRFDAPRSEDGYTNNYQRGDNNYPWRDNRPGPENFSVQPGEHDPVDERPFGVGRRLSQHSLQPPPLSYSGNDDGRYDDIAPFAAPPSAPGFGHSPIPPTIPPPNMAVPLPDVSRPPPSLCPIPALMSIPPPEFLPEDLIPSLPYYDLPAGLMVPLVRLEDSEYKPLNPDDIRLPPPAPPSDRLLAAIKAFYTPPGHDRPRDSDGWEKLGLYEYYRAKGLARSQKAEDIASGKREKTRSPSPVTRARSKSRSPVNKKRYRSRSRSKSKGRSSRSPRNNNRSSRRSPRRSRRKDKSRSSSLSPIQDIHRSPTPPSFGGAAFGKFNDKLDESNKGHQLLRKMGWGGAGLGANEQGIEAPISGGEIRDRADQYKGVGINLNDPYESFRKSKGQAFITRMKERAEERLAGSC